MRILFELALLAVIAIGAVGVYKNLARKLKGL